MGDGQNYRGVATMFNINDLMILFFFMFVCLFFLENWYLVATAIKYQGKQCSDTFFFKNAFKM